MNNIRQLKDKLDERAKELGALEDALQTICGHPNVTKTPRANTGNYDPLADSYWYDYCCPDCDKRWAITQ